MHEPVLEKGFYFNRIKISESILGFSRKTCNPPVEDINEKFQGVE